MKQLLYDKSFYKIHREIYVGDNKLTFKFIFRNSPKLSFTDWNKYLDEIAKNKKVDGNALKGKLVECGRPGFTGATVRFYV